MQINKTGPLFPFLFVGCWNKTGGQTEKGERQVFGAMKSHDLDAKYLFLGGDNVYPDKYMNSSGKKRKTYSVERLHQGISLLPPIPTYVALGNHNVYDPDIYVEETHTDKWNLPADYYSLYFSDERMGVIVLDTNLYQDDTLYEKRKKMESWFLKSVKGFHEDHVEYILIQHEPLFSLKNGKLSILPNQDLFRSILDQFPPLTILCADTHNYQHIQFKTSRGLWVSQIVVGTGGAEQDTVGDTRILPRDFFEFTDLHFHEPSLTKYGYLRVFRGDGWVVNTEFKYIK